MKNPRIKDYEKSAMEHGKVENCWKNGCGGTDVKAIFMNPSPGVTELSQTPVQSQIYNAVAIIIQWLPMNAFKFSAKDLSQFVIDYKKGAEYCSIIKRAVKKEKPSYFQRCFNASIQYCLRMKFECGIHHLGDSPHPSQILQGFVGVLGQRTDSLLSVSTKQCIKRIDYLSFQSRKLSILKIAAKFQQYVTSSDKERRERAAVHDPSSYIMEWKTGEQFNYSPNILKRMPKLSTPTYLREIQTAAASEVCFTLRATGNTSQNLQHNLMQNSKRSAVETNWASAVTTRIFGDSSQGRNRTLNKASVNRIEAKTRTGDRLILKWEFSTARSQPMPQTKDRQVGDTESVQPAINIDRLWSDKSYLRYNVIPPTTSMNLEQAKLETSTPEQTPHVTAANATALESLETASNQVEHFREEKRLDACAIWWQKEPKETNNPCCIGLISNGVRLQPEVPQSLLSLRVKQLSCNLILSQIAYFYF
ncbi:hypothetical protein C0J52_25451 [Blattella germanica]|nr:hypothetical protein C0J52_25451 [Blattella germanica]